MRYPLLPRILVAVLGLLVFSQSAATALDLEAQGFPRTAAAEWIVGGVLAVFLFALSVAPGELDALLPRGSRVDLRRAAHFGAIVAAVGSLYVLLGLAGVVDTVHGLELQERGEDPFGIEDERTVLVGLALNAVVLLGAPFLWVASTRPGEPVFRALGLTSERGGRAFGLGIVFALLAIAVAAAATVVVTNLTGWTLPVNERALGIGAALSPVGAFLVAAASGLVEEVYFRGWLQPRIGLLGQALVFTAAHLNYLHVGETIAVFVLALLFGLLFRATKNLWAPIGAHFAFNLVMLLAASAA